MVSSGRKAIVPGGASGIGRAATERLRKADIEVLAERKKAVPLKRGASADECAGLICFHLSNAAAYATGQALNFTSGIVSW